MSYHDRITHCLTIGRRPDLLQRTLKSLRGLPALPTIAINDFGDGETNEAFRAGVPGGRLLTFPERLGHHRAVDALYAEVTTDLIFHNEDDWDFTRTDFLDEALALLDADPKIVSVCLRDSRDIPALEPLRDRVVTSEVNGIAFQRLDALHDQWYGFSFNPHLIRKSLWSELGGYGRFERERHISRHLKAQERYVAYLVPPACVHNGEGRSAFSGRPSAFKRFKTWMRAGLR